MPDLTIYRTKFLPYFMACSGCFYMAVVTDAGERGAETPHPEASPYFQRITQREFEALEKHPGYGLERIPLYCSDSHPLDVWGIAFGPHGELLASSSRDRVYVWHLKKGRLAALIHDKSMTVAIGFSTDGRLLGTLNALGGITFWNLEHGRLEAAFPQSNGFAFSPDGQHVALCSGNEVAICDVRTMEPTRRLVRGCAPVWAMRYSPNGDQLVVGTTENCVEFWSTSPTIAQQERHPIEAGRPCDLAFSPGGRFLAVACESMLGPGGVCLIDRSNRRVMTVGNRRGYRYVGFALKGKALFMVDEAANFQVFYPQRDATESLDFCSTFAFEQLALDLSPDGEIVAYVNGAAKNIQLLDLRSGQHIRKGSPEFEVPVWLE